MPNTKITTIIRLTVIAALMLAGSGYFFKACLEGLKEPYLERGWKVTKGKVLSQDLVLTGKMNVQRKAQEGFNPLINYEYSIGENKYRSNLYAVEGLANQEDYPEGKVVDVYYNPKDFSQSVLVRTETQKQYLYGMMLSCIVVAGVVIFHYIRDIRNL